MNTISDNQIKSARKEYACDACSIIINAFGSFVHFLVEFSDQLTDEEINALSKAKAQEYKILKGDSYRKVFYVDDNNEATTFRGLTDIEKICQNYDLYEEQ